MKLYSIKLEVRALKTICTSVGGKVSSTMLAKLTKDHFYDDTTSECFNRILSIVRSSGNIPHWDELLVDPVLTEPVRDELAEYRNIKPTKSIERVNLIFEHLDKFRKARVLHKSSETIIRALDRDSVDVDSLLNKTIDRVSTAQTSNISFGDSTVIIGEKSNARKYVSKLLSGDRPDVFRTGFKAFDSENGGFLPGSLAIIAAVTGGGKSSMANQLAINMAKAGLKICLVPLEMTKEECLARVVANVAKVEVSKYLYTKLTKNEIKRTKSTWVRFEKEVKEVGGSFQIHEPDGDVSIEEILTILKPYDYDVVIVDYIGLLKGADGDDSWRLLGNIARFGKIWARNENKLLIMLAQLSSEGDVRYSRTIVEHANNVWSWTYTDENRESGIIEVVPLKARNQKVFDFPLEHDFSTMRIFDVDSDTPPESRRSPQGEKRRRRLKEASSFEEVDRYLDTGE